jgi:hypothetical protein
VGKIPSGSFAASSKDAEHRPERARLVGFSPPCWLSRLSKRAVKNCGYASLAYRPSNWLSASISAVPECRRCNPFDDQASNDSGDALATLPWTQSHFPRAAASTQLGSAGTSNPTLTPPGVQPQNRFRSGSCNDLGVLPGSLITGQIRWVIYGGIAAVARLALLL